MCQLLSTEGTDDKERASVGVRWAPSEGAQIKGTVTLQQHCIQPHAWAHVQLGMQNTLCLTGFKSKNDEKCQRMPPRRSAGSWG